MFPKHPEIGVYGDGAYGHQWTRERCADVLEFYAQENFTSRGRAVPAPAGGLMSLDDLIADLRDEMSDDASEEDAACDWLNDFAPVKCSWWGWYEGDFGLWPENFAGDE